MHVYEPTSDQSFFVHAPLLLKNGFPDIIDPLSTGYPRGRCKGKVTFVRLNRDGPQVVREPPLGGRSHGQ